MLERSRKPGCDSLLDVTKHSGSVFATGLGVKMIHQQTDVGSSTFICIYTNRSMNMLVTSRPHNGRS